MNAMMPQAPARSGHSPEGFIRAVIDIASNPGEFKQRLADMEAKRAELAKQAEDSIVAAQTADAKTAAAIAAVAACEKKRQEVEDYTAAAKLELERLKTRAAEEALKREAALDVREKTMKSSEDAYAQKASAHVLALTQLDTRKNELTTWAGSLFQREKAVTAREAALVAAKAEHDAHVREITAALSKVR